MTCKAGDDTCVCDPSCDDDDEFGDTLVDEGDADDPEDCWDKCPRCGNLISLDLGGCMPCQWFLEDGRG